MIDTRARRYIILGIIHIHSRMHTLHTKGRFLIRARTCAYIPPCWVHTHIRTRILANPIARNTHTLSIRIRYTQREGSSYTRVHAHTYPPARYIHTYVRAYSPTQ